MTIYLLLDDYAPDAGSRIYGAYSTREKADAAYEHYESDDNEYGDGCDSLSIRTLTVQ